MNVESQACLGLSRFGIHDLPHEAARDIVGLGHKLDGPVWVCLNAYHVGRAVVDCGAVACRQPDGLEAQIIDGLLCVGDVVEDVVIPRRLSFMLVDTILRS